MKTANLTGALLDYWVARAEGTPAEQLEIRPVQRPDPRTPDAICVRRVPYGADQVEVRVQYSISWAFGGPLIGIYGCAPVPFQDEGNKVWGAFILGAGVHHTDACFENAHGQGDTPLIAICRAVVRAAFGDEVEDLPCA